ncbi:MAG: acetate--CoA ligase family protein [bacterium]|nr:acetate--CoA ligase family protein [bacterium]
MLDGLFRPRAVGVIGASANPYSIGHIVVRNLTRYGFKGPVFPVNPKGGVIRSMQAYKSILDVPCDVDLVNISIRNTFVPGVLEECGRKGVKFAIVHSAGFKEVGPEGEELEREMVATAHEHGIRVFGPNSQGIQNADPEVSVYANFTFVPQKPGNISIIAQGGGMGEMLKLHLHNVGLGHRMYCSYGNECDLTMPEILAYYGQDEGTRVIMMQTESFKDPRAFLEAAAAITPHKPILAIKAGRTSEGSLAVSSHTGALVDQVTMAEAMYRQAGVVQFTDTHEMIKAAIAMSTQDAPPGNRIGIITNTGGPGIQAVDESVNQGLELAKWSDAGTAKLKEALFAEASLGNPVDVVATADHNHYHAAVSTLLAEADTDMVMVFFVTAPFTDIDAIAMRIKEATEGSDKPVVVVVETFSENYRLIENLRAADLPVYEFAEDGARALAALNRYALLRERPREDVPDLDVNRDAAETIVARYRGRDTYLPQAEAFDLLAAYGVSVPRMAVVAGADDLETAAKKVGFPCVLKVDAAEVVHKSDAGGVVLNLADMAALQEAFAAMHAAIAGPDVSYLLMEQKSPGQELILGAKASPGLGSLVMFGLGGIFVEVLKDVGAAVAPLSRPEARELMRSIKGYPVLEGLRGQPGADLDALEDLLIRVSLLAGDFPDIAEMDLNPIFAYPAGQDPTAVDVRLRIS